MDSDDRQYTHLMPLGLHSRQVIQNEHPCFQHNQGFQRWKPGEILGLNESRNNVQNEPADFSFASRLPSNVTDRAAGPVSDTINPGFLGPLNSTTFLQQLDMPLNTDTPNTILNPSQNQSMYAPQRISQGSTNDGQPDRLTVPMTIDQPSVDGESAGFLAEPLPSNPMVNECHVTTSSHRSDVRHDVRVLSPQPVVGNTSAAEDSFQNSSSCSTDESTSVEYILLEGGSTRGRNKLVSSDGFSYCIKANSGRGKEVWRCSKRSKKGNCPAIVKRTGDHFTRGARSHSHECDYLAKENFKSAKQDGKTFIDSPLPAGRLAKHKNTGKRQKNSNNCATKNTKRDLTCSDSETSNELETCGGPSEETRSTGEESLNFFCTPCGGESVAQGFCKVCKEYYCKECLICHRRFRMSREHPILQGEEMLTDRSSSSCAIFRTERCQTHKDEFIQYFCNKHRAFFCNRCFIMNHRTCNTDFIPEKATTVKDTGEYIALKSVVERFDAYMGKVQQKVKDCASSTVKDIKTFRKDLNTSLDKMESEELAKAKQLNEDVIDHIKKRGDAAIGNIKLRLTEYEDHPVQLYMFTKRKYSDLQEVNSDCDKLMKEQFKTYQFKPSDKLKELLKAEHLFGQLKMVHSETVEPNSFRQQLNIENMTLRFAWQFSVKIEDDGDYDDSVGCDKCQSYVTGIAFLSDRYLLIADEGNDAIKLIDTNTQKITSVLHFPTNFGVFDVTCLPGMEAAVTLSLRNQIQIVSTCDGLEAVRRFPVSGRCSGICYSDEQLIVTYPFKKYLEIMDLNGIVHKKVLLDGDFFNTFRPSQCTVKHNHIYVTNHFGQCMYKLAMDGRIVSVFEEYYPGGVTGLAAVGDSYIVVGNACMGEVSLLRDGRNIHIVEEGYINVACPVTIDVCPDDKSICVGTKDGYVFMYKFTQPEA